MKLNQYLKGKNRSEFAQKIGSTKSYIDLLACGSRCPSKKLALRIQEASEGQVTVLEALFPDDQGTAKGRNNPV